MGGGGGAWKVAFADFVTAMMALFLVLWIVNQDEEVKGEVSAYFQTRYWSLTKDSPGIIPNDNMELVQSKKAHFDNASFIPLMHIKKISKDLLEVYVKNPNYIDMKTMRVQTTDDGLLVNIFDNPERPVFEAGNPEKLTEYGEFVFQTVAWTLARHNDTEVEVEGHTSSNLAGDKWKVSTTRSLKVRELMRGQGVRQRQFKKVAGYSDTKPLPQSETNPALNDRVTIRIRAGS